MVKSTRVTPEEAQRSKDFILKLAKSPEHTQRQVVTGIANEIRRLEPYRGFAGIIGDLAGPSSTTKLLDSESRRRLELGVDYYTTKYSQRDN